VTPPELTPPELTPRQVAELDQGIAVFEQAVDELLTGVPVMVAVHGRERAVAAMYARFRNEHPAKVEAIAAVALVRLAEHTAGQP
jgi:hypothetical protein